MDSHSAVEQRVRAAATDMNGAVVVQDYLDVIGDYQRKEAVFWNLIPAQNKKKATSDIIREILRGAYPRVGATDRNTLDSVAATTRNTQGSLARDFSDPGQALKCIYGDVDASYFERSLQEQQGNQWGNTFAENTADLFSSAVRYRDQKLFTGNATTNPLEFNGLVNLMNPQSTNVYLDMRGAPEPEIFKKLIEVSIGVSTEANENHMISHIFTSGTGQFRLIDQVADTNIYENQVAISPGHTVPGIVVPGARNNNSMVPIVTSRYLPDEINVNDPDPNGNPADLVDLVPFYLVDMTTIYWYGLVPFMGRDSLDFQVFDLVSNTIGNQALTMRRYLLLFGCLFSKNRGRGIHKVTLKLDPNTAYTRRTEATPF